MSINYGFKHDTSYGADDVNAVFARLFTGGKLAYKTNITEDVIGCIGNITDGGVIGDSLKISVSDNGIMIGEGAGLFSDGSWVTVDADGYLFKTADFNDKYIGFVKSVGTGIVEPVISSEKIEDNTNYYYIWLGYVDADGTAAGVRDIAAAKLVSNTPNIYVTKTLSNLSVHSSNPRTYTLDVGREGFRYLLFKIDNRNTPNAYYNVVDLNTYDGSLVYVGIDENFKGIISTSGSIVTIKVHAVGSGTSTGDIEMMAV